MYRLIPICFLLLCCLACSRSLQHVTITGYRQSIIPGKKAQQQTNPTFKYRLFVYSNKAIVVKQVWIDGNNCLFETHPVLVMPVTDTILGREMILADSPSSRKVTELRIIRFKQKEQPATGSKLNKEVNRNDIVITYQYKNKSRTAALKKMKELEPVFLQ